MDLAMIQNWNSVVRPDDIIYHLGDFCMGGRKPEEYLCRLNGKLFLVPGNHDKEVRFQGQFTRQHEVVILPELVRVSLNGQYMTLSHYSMRVWDKSHYGAWNLHGHSHGTLPSIGKQKDVGVDCTHYKPISFEQLKVAMDLKSANIVDHHGSGD
jgi:calcineurin-like phosphoesterase family protein